MPRPAARLSIVPFLCLLLTAPLPARAGDPKRTVIVVSVDGLAAHYLPDASLKTLERLRREGAHAARMIPTFPSITFPNHATLATGCSAGKHGIVGNKFIDKKRGEFLYSNDPSWLECEPIWVTAERNGRRAAVGHWPSSFGAWNGVEATHREKAYDKSLSSRREFRKLARLLGSPKEKRPSLLMGYVEAVDSTGHRFGPSSPERKRALARVDRDLAWLFEEIKKIPDLGEWAFLLVSDHGMTEVDRRIPLEAFVQTRELGGILVHSGALAYLYLWDPATGAQAKSLLAALPGANAYLAGELPSKWGRHHRRMGDVVTVLEPGNAFLWKPEKKDTLKGMHGYDPAQPAMAALFIAWGSGVAAGKSVPEIRSVDVAPTVAKLLDMPAPRDAEGRAVEELLAGASRGED